MMLAARVKPSTTTPTQSSLTSLRVEEMWARPWMVEELRNSATEVSSPDILGSEQTGDYYDQTGDYCVQKGDYFERRAISARLDTRV